MKRKYNEDKNWPSDSFHSIDELNRLLSKTNCLLMRDHNIGSIEDLIQLFLDQGESRFTDLMVNLFKVDPFIIEKFNGILRRWSRKSS